MDGPASHCFGLEVPNIWVPVRRKLQAVDGLGADACDLLQHGLLLGTQRHITGQTLSRCVTTSHVWQRGVT